MEIQKEQLGIFSDLIKALMFEEHLQKAKQLHEWLIGKDCNIAYSSLVRYISGSACPSFGKAKQILNAFNYDIEDESLNEMLLNSKKTADQNESSVMKGTVLSAKDFGISVVQIESLINQRILETESSSFSNYVSRLIKKDLNESGLL